MADRRKLQGDIDRCLKKVDEGVETFEDIWKKVQTATNSNQKEKFETDLKKEIKKLQRLRDQIKSWIANSDIKDKSSLMEHRKLIETQMERFKVVERETKTKAYSKDGLGAAAKLDPHTKEKCETTLWLSSLIDALNLQLDQFESELESRASTSKKRAKDPKCEELRQHQDRHKWHIEMLEKIMRHVDNDKLAVDKVKDIREDIEYYVQSNQDPSFEDNGYLYEELDLEEITDATTLASSPTESDDILVEKVGSTPSSTNSSSPSPSPSINANHSSDKHDDTERKRHKSQSEEKKSASPAPHGNSKTQLSSAKHSQNNSSTQNTENNSVNSNHHPLTTLPPLTTPYAAAAGAQQNASGSRNSQPTPSVWQRSLTAQSSFPIDSSKPHINSIEHSAATGNLSSSSNGSGTTNTNSVSLTSSGNPSVPSAPSPQVAAGAATPSVNTVNSSASSAINSSQVHSSRTDGPPVVNGPLSAVGSTSQKVKNDEMSLRTMAQQVIANAELDKLSSSRTPSDLSNVYMTTQVPSQPTAPSSSEQCSVSLSDQQQQQLSAQLPQQQIPPAAQTNTIHLNPLLGMAPLGSVLLSKEQHYQSDMVDAAFHHLPHPSDSEKMRHFLPRNPCPTPGYYPSASFPHADTVEFYQRCNTETLFFIFYYMEGTKAQYLAAKALKKQSWRFHTKYLMWFQRHEEPKQITEEFEQGTYVYFDYEKWCQKKKDNFTFEYRYLEDRDLN